jgi:hypothetical protein
MKPDPKPEFDLTHVRHDPMHCLCPGLFRSLLRGDRKNQKLDITYQHGDEKIRFIGFEPLDAGDLRLLQGLVAMSGAEGLNLSSEPKSVIGKILRMSLNATLEAKKENAMMVKTSVRNLLAEIGLSGSGDNIKTAKASLTRMSNVSVVLTQGTRTASPGYQLLAFTLDESDGELCVALNPRLTAAIVGDDRHVRIDMNEVRALNSDPARLIHQRLCAWINTGSAGRAEIETLCGYAWPDEANLEAMKKRKQSIRKALAELVSLGWIVTEYAKGKFEIFRPESPRCVVTLPNLRRNVPHVAS